MEEIGVVREIHGPKALIAVQKKSSCESCPGGSVCKKLGANEMMIEAVNDVKAGIGDTVRVSFRPYTYIKGTALIYGVPALMLIVGAVIGKEYLSRILAFLDPDIASAIGGFGLFIISFLIIKLWSKGYESKKEDVPIVEEILNPKY
ncbi:MAG: SoxR reducing system RseC family protein [Nitrospirota bacterium]